MSFDQIMRNLIQSFQSGKVILFCGAGISINSSLPLAWHFRESILEQLGVSEPERNLIHKAALPFESFVSILQENSNIKALLNIFNKGQPTLQHKFIAELVVAGKVKFIVTTNFDMLIERALKARGWRANQDYCIAYREQDFNKIDWENGKPTIIKIHGSVHDRQSMAITLRQVAGTIYSESRKKIIDRVFCSGNHEYVLITGYSCSDFFDITPYTQMIQDGYKKVVLIEHDTEHSFVENIQVQAKRNPFTKFPNSYRIHDRTEALVESLWSTILGMPNITNGEGKDTLWQENVQRWSSSTSVSRAAKQLIIGRIWMDIDNEKYRKEAAQYFQGAIDAAQIDIDGDRKREAFALSLLGNLTNSVPRLEEALSISIEIKDKNLQASCLCSLIPAYLDMRQVSKAIDCGNEGLKIAEEIGDKSREARLHGNMGGVYWMIGKLDTAMAHLTKGYLISQEIGDKAEEGRALFNIASAYDSKIWDNRAEKNYKQSRDIFLTYLGEDHPNIKEIDNCLARLARKPRIIKFSDL